MTSSDVTRSNVTLFKICGLRDTEAAVAAAECGADFLGFNFVHGVRRQIAAPEAKAIIDEYRRRRGEGGPKLVGLFADQPVEEVNGIVKECGLDLAQLCGDETPEFFDRVSVPVIKQIRVRDGDPNTVKAEIEREIVRVEDAGATPHLDKHKEGQLGGTGSRFDWSIGRDLAAAHRVLVAGGLTPDNVGRAIEEMRPWGVDVSSGVETDGVKDAAKIRAFAAAVKRAS